MTSPDWSPAIEIHPPAWICPDEAFWVAGRAASASGLVQCDVRAWLDDQPSLGLCGLPGGGFSFLLKPVPGAVVLRIEICDQHGRWSEIFRHNITTAASVTSVATQAPVGPSATALLDLLRAKYVRPAESWTTLADEILTARRAEAFDVMPSDPFKGALEQMATRVAVHYDHLLITGWVAHRTQPIVKLTAWLDTDQPQSLLHGLDRPDAGAMFPDFCNAASGRFAGHLRLPERIPRPLALRIFAETKDGQCALVFLKRLQPVLVSGAGTDLPPLSRWMFIQAARALNRAAWHQRWTDPAWRAFLTRTWQTYRASVPAKRLPAASTEIGPATRRPLTVTLVTHNLNFEGAPLFLLELARHLAAQPDWKVRLVSAQTGPLAPRFADAGIPVSIAAPSVSLATSDQAAFDTALADLAMHEVWAGADLIIANTLVAFWAVPLARLLHQPSMLYVHESAAIRRFFALDFSPAALTRVEQSLLMADRVVFPAADGQRAHAYLNHRSHFRALPGWVDVSKIQTYLAAHDRTAQRQALNLAPGAVTFAHVGSFIPRKGLHVLIAAIRLLLNNTQDAPPLVFLLVGAGTGPDPYADLVRHAVADIPGADIRIVPQSPDPYRYFQAADIFVCASLEEVFPRVVLEAAVFGRAVVTTNVNGIPEMLGPREAWLVPPAHAPHLAEAMGSALIAHLRGDTTRSRRAQLRVTRHFDSAIMLPRHTELIRAVATGRPI